MDNKDCNILCLYGLIINKLQLNIVMKNCKVMRNYFLLFVLLFVGCGKNVELKRYWAYDTQLTEDGFCLIDTVGDNAERLLFKSGDKIFADSIIEDIFHIEMFDDEGVARHIKENYPEKIFKHSYYAEKLDTTFEFDAIYTSLVREFGSDCYVDNWNYAGVATIKKKYSKLKGNLSGQELFEPVDAISMDWSLKENITADMSFFLGKDWWGYPRYQWKVEITNNSTQSFDRSFEIKIKCYNYKHEMIGEAYGAVGDFLAIGETMSKTIYLTDIDDRVAAEYYRLYINDVYFGEFLNE